MKIFKQISVIFLVFVTLAGLSTLVLAAQAPIGLGTADSFAVLAGAGITNTGTTTINGDVGSYPTTTQTGFGTVTITGTNHAGDGVTQTAKTDLVTAYNDAAGRGPTIAIVADLGGQTLTPGVYNTASSIGLTGNLTLDAQGDPNAVFIFQSGSTLITAGSSSVTLINGAQACNVFWQVGSSATLGTNSTFKGTILSLTAITLTTGANVEGRVLTRNAALTADSNVIVRPVCAVTPSLPSTGFGPKDTTGPVIAIMTVMAVVVVAGLFIQVKLKRQEA